MGMRGPKLDFDDGVFHFKIFNSRLNNDATDTTERVY